MAQYFQLQAYVDDVRGLLQDLVLPYRYEDVLIAGAVVTALLEASRIRPDIFLDLKYQQPFKQGDLGDGVPSAFMRLTDVVPIPAKYTMPIEWYAYGMVQLYDVTDTQDQRAQAFLSKFQQQLMTLSAA